MTWNPADSEIRKLPWNFKNLHSQVSGSVSNRAAKSSTSFESPYHANRKTRGREMQGWGGAQEWQCWRDSEQNSTVICVTDIQPWSLHLLPVQPLLISQCNFTSLCPRSSLIFSSPVDLATLHFRGIFRNLFAMHHLYESSASCSPGRFSLTSLGYTTPTDMLSN